MAGKYTMRSKEEKLATLNIHIKRSALRGVVQPITDNIHNSTFYQHPIKFQHLRE